MKKMVLVYGLVLVTALGMIHTESQAADKLPRILNLGTMPAGMLVNIQGTGLADLISKHSPMDVKIRAVTSEEVWAPMMLTDEIDLGVAVSLSMRNAYLGTAVFQRIAKRLGIKNFPLRLITVGTPIRISFLVQGKSSFKKIADLKGKTVAWFAKKTAFDLYTRALLANGGLKPEDVKKFPVANPIEATRAVMNGNADASMVAVDAPIVAEAVAKVKAHWLTVDGSADASKRMQDVIATAYVETCPGGKHLGIPKDQPFMYLDVYLVGHVKLADAVAYEVTKVLWVNDAELVKKLMLKAWLTDRFVSKQASVPCESFRGRSNSTRKRVCGRKRWFNSRNNSWTRNPRQNKSLHVVLPIQKPAVPRRTGRDESRTIAPGRDLGLNLLPIQTRRRLHHAENTGSGASLMLSGNRTSRGRLVQRAENEEERLHVKCIVHPARRFPPRCLAHVTLPGKRRFIRSPVA